VREVLKPYHHHRNGVTMPEPIERRHSWRLWCHTTFDIAKIAALIAACHLLIRLAVAVPIIVIEVRQQTEILIKVHELIKEHK
jgi:hypothetical protein